MSAKNRQLQRKVREYRKDGQKWAASTAEIARWAVKTGRHDLTRPSLERQFARELAQAMREEYFADGHGRRVRAKHPARFTRNGHQMVVWDDMRTAPHHHMQMAFLLRRRRIMSECKHVKTDVDSYNDAHFAEVPIQMVLDFTKDVEELETFEVVQNASHGKLRDIREISVAI